MNYWKMVNEHSLVGVTSGVYFGTGELALAHMQNSGREAQEKADRLGNFYNAGYMGGTSFTINSIKF